MIGNITPIKTGTEVLPAGKTIADTFSGAWSMHGSRYDNMTLQTSHP